LPLEFRNVNLDSGRRIKKREARIEEELRRKGTYRL